jgi:Holliday junction DNA helicase RuvB
VDIPPFTLIAATDQPGRLKNALQQRMGLRFTLSDYDEKEMRVIVSNRAAELGILLSLQAVTRIAQAARGVPRKARQILEGLRTCIPDLTVEVTKVAANRHLSEIQGIDQDNLNRDDRAYLAVLDRQGGFVSLESLAMQIGLDFNQVRRDVELYVLKQGWVTIDHRGRSLTVAGKLFVSNNRLIQKQVAA